MKLLVAGAGTPAGRDFLALLKSKDIDHLTVPDRLLNGSDTVGLRELFGRNNPDQLVNFHTYKANSQSAVQRAENSAKACTTIQHHHTSLLVELCAQVEIPLLHLSTCYVFNGEKKLGYNEQDEVRPVGVYGNSAVKGEQAVSQLQQHIILRTGWTFGPTQYNVLKNWIKACKKNQGLMEVQRRRFSPTCNEDLARVVLAVCQQIDCDANVWGTFHYCGLETKKESEFVKQILNYASQQDEGIYQLIDSIVIKETSPELPEVPNSTLSSKKIFDTFGIKQRSWHGSLQNTIKSIYLDDPQLGSKAEPESQGTSEIQDSDQQN